MLNDARLAMRFLWREWRAGEWIIVFIALILSVTIVTALHFYIDRLMRGLDNQGAKLLGGDLVIESSSPILPDWINKAKEFGLKTAEVWSYPSVASTTNQLQLVTIEAVSKNYPLFGKSIHPAHLKAFVESRLLTLLSLKPNSTITIGNAQFSIEKLDPSHSDMPNLGWVIAPKVRIALEDVPLTHTVLPGSRVNYRLLITGNQSQLSRYRNWITSRLTVNQQLLDVRNPNFVLRNILERADHYLQLIILFCLMMSGVAIALSIQQYLRRHYDHVALWRCLGSTGKQIVRIFLWQLVLISLGAGFIGVLLAYAIQNYFAALFNEFIQFNLPSPSMSPVLVGFGISIFLLFIFAYPVVLALPRISPLAVWRNQSVGLISREIYFVLALIFISFFLFVMMKFSLLALFFVDIVTLSIGILYLISLGILRLTQKLADNTEGVIRRGLSQLTHYPESVSLQFIGFSLVLIAIIVLSLLRNELFTQWQKSLPKNTPNYFAINIAQSDITSLSRFFNTYQIKFEAFYPIVKGRLIKLNGKPIMTAVPEEARGHNALHRELYLTQTFTLPSDNKIIMGQPWNAGLKEKNAISFEKRLGEQFGLKLADELTFQINNIELTGKIVNFRQVDWQSFHPNFFVIFPPGILNPFPTTYMTSFYLMKEQQNLLNEMIKIFPNLTIIDVANLLDQVHLLLSKITLALQYLFLFALFSGLLIFITSLQASLDERRHSYRLVRVLGASKNYIVKSLAVEFGFFFFMTITVSFILAKIISRSLMYYFF